MSTSESLTASERSLRARVAANTRWSKEDPVAGTAAARAMSPGSVDYWQRQVDPDETLDPTERLRRAQCAKKAHFQRLAIASARARRVRAS